MQLNIIKSKDRMKVLETEDQSVSSMEDDDVEDS